MKTKRILFILITIIMLTATTSVNAAYEKTGTITGHVNFGSAVHMDLGCTSCTHDYKYFDYQFIPDGGGGPYPAYCISPDYTGSHGIPLSCELANPKIYAEAYYILNKYGTSADKAALALAIRVAGFQSNGLEDNANFAMDATQQYRIAFAASTMYYMGIAQNPKFDGYVLKGGIAPSAFAMWKDAALVANDQRAKGTLKDNITTTYTASAITEEAGAQGKLVKLTVKEVIESENGSGAKIVKYRIDKTVSGELGRLKVISDGNVIATVKEWNGTTGELVVTPTSETNCEGSIIITAADVQQVSGEPGKTIYKCTGNGNETQQFLILGPDLIGDEFPVKFDCDSCEEAGEGDAGDDCTTFRLPGDPVYDSNNCCEDGGYKNFRQEILNNIFCYNKTLDVQNYKLKCGAEVYLDTVIDEEFCSLSCVQSMHYKLPGVTYAKAGRYFKLANQGSGEGGEITGPILTMYYRCRTLINYEKWYGRYFGEVEKQVEGYNKHQQNKAYQMVWEDLKPEGENHLVPLNDDTGVSEVKCDYEYSYSWNCTETAVVNGVTVTKSAWSEQSGGGSGSKSEDIDNVKAKSYKFEYVHASTNDKYKYNVIRLDADGGVEHTPFNGEKKYTYINVVYDHVESPHDGTRYLHKDDVARWEGNFDKAYNDAKKEADEAYNSLKSGDNTVDHSSTNVSCSKSVTDRAPVCTSKPSPGVKVDPDKKISDYRTAKENGGDAVENAAKEAKSLEERLTKCDTEAQKIVKITETPEMQFSYTQAYINDYGKVQTDLRTIPFTRHCSEGTQHGGESSWNPAGDSGGASGQHGIDADKYSIKEYKTGIDTVTDFATAGGHWVDTLFPFSTSFGKNAIVKDHKDSEYESHKNFTTDDVAWKECYWTDSENNKLYTLVPAGEVGYVTTENYTIHDRTYFVTKTHMEGEFQTYFTMSNVGKDYLWDEFLLKTDTCKGGREDGATATCKIIIDNEIPETGKCNEVVTTATNICNSCYGDKPCGSVTIPFEYKEIDNLNPFVYDELYKNSVAHNWLIDPVGKAELSKIVETAKKDKTYAPENLTYSFTLTPKDLKAIRSYNKKRLYQGGYTDFTLECHDGVKTENGVVERCYSKFLTAISGGSGFEGLEINTFNGNINSVRESLRWNYNNIER